MDHFFFLYSVERSTILYKYVAGYVVVVVVLVVLERWDIRNRRSLFSFFFVAWGRECLVRNRSVVRPFVRSSVRASAERVAFRRRLRRRRRRRRGVVEGEGGEKGSEGPDSFSVQMQMCVMLQYPQRRTKQKKKERGEGKKKEKERCRYGKGCRTSVILMYLVG